MTFNSSEQFYFYKKSLHANDRATAKKILQARNANEAKILSKQIQGLNKQAWTTDAERIMELACFLKFSQNPDLMQKLLESKGTLVEANPNDKKWSCGLSLTNPHISNKEKWTGSNILGKVLQSVKDRLTATNKDH